MISLPRSGPALFLRPDWGYQNKFPDERRLCIPYMRWKEKDVTLSFGIFRQALKITAQIVAGVATTDANDPSFAGNNQNRWSPNVGAGIYAYNNKFFAGVSVFLIILANRLNGPAALFATNNQYCKAISKPAYYRWLCF